MGWFEDLFGGPARQQAQVVANFGQGVAQQAEGEKFKSEEQRLRDEVEGKVNARRAELEPALKGAQQGLLRSQSQGRQGLMANLARLGVRGADAGKKIGQFESNASANLAAQEFNNRLSLNNALDNYRASQLNERMVFDQRFKDQQALMSQRMAQQNRELFPETGTEIFNAVAGPLLGAAVGGAGNAIGKGAGNFVSGLFKSQPSAGQAGTVGGSGLANFGPTEPSFSNPAGSTAGGLRLSNAPTLADTLGARTTQNRGF